MAVETSAPAHAEIVSAVTAARQHGLEKELGKLGELTEISSKLVAVQDVLRKNVPPEKPEKPTYEKPTYTGAWPISGECRGRYTDDQGVVLLARGQYYVIKEAEPCETPYLHGYVASTGATVPLDIGRDGREGIVVTLEDRETYADDQKSFRDEVTGAQADHKTALKEYPQRLREWEQAVANAKWTTDLNTLTRDKLAARWRSVLGCDGATAPAAGLTVTPLTEPGSRRAGVDPDCYEEGSVCSKARLADVEAMDTLTTSTIATAGWPVGCYEMRYIAGDVGEKDAISVSVATDQGARCKSASKAQLAQLGESLKRLIIGKPFARNVDLLQVTDGSAIEVQIPLVVSSPSAPKATRGDNPTSPEAVTPPESAEEPGEPEAATPEATGCDEVSCALSKYADACCAKFKKEPKATDSAQEPSEGLDRTMISEGMNKVKARVMACGEKSSASGQVKVSVTVEPSGSVSSVSVKTTPDAGLGSCVASAVQKAVFQATKNGGSFAYPFLF